MMETPTTRLAILEADRLFPHAAEKYGRYGGVFVDLFDAASEKLGLRDGALEISLWDIEEEDMYPRLEDIDAILITGSRMFLPPTTVKRWVLKDSQVGTHMMTTLHGSKSLSSSQGGCCSSRPELGYLAYVLVTR